MATLNTNGIRLAYVERGTGSETVVLSHSYLVDHRQFDAQLEALAQRYRVLAYDHRGHGQSDKPAEGYDLDALCADAAGFIEQTDAAPCHFVGLSTGGFVGMRLALRRPELLRRLVLMDTSADAEPLAARIKYEAMFGVLLAAGFAPLVGATMPIMFGPRFLADPERRDEVALWRQRLAQNEPRALVRFGHGIFGRASVIDRLGAITTPTLVMVGEHDRATPPFRAQRIADHIAGAELALIEGAGHLSTIEQPERVNAALLTFLGGERLKPTQRAARSPRSTRYDGAAYGRLIEPLLAGVHRFVADHLPAGERVLDACCGTGGLARRLTAGGRQVLGVDLSPRNIAFARARSSGDNPRYQVGDVSHLPAHADGAFALATMVMALHEMPQVARAAVLHELGRVAEQVLVVDFEAPMARNLAGWRNRLVELLAGREHFAAFRDWQHRGGLDPLAEQAGLRARWQRQLDGGTLRAALLRRR